MANRKLKRVAFTVDLSREKRGEVMKWNFNIDLTFPIVLGLHQRIDQRINFVCLMIRQDEELYQKCKHSSRKRGWTRA